MKTQTISRYRSAIMGFAILWIMTYHSSMSFSFLPLLGDAVNNVRSNGFGGVDLFMFVSGFGLYRALSKKPGQLAFYKRRLARVLPAYLPVLLVWFFLNLPAVSLGSWPGVILGNLTGTAFWVNTNLAFNWYMLALFSFYFIAPFFFEVVELPWGAGWLIFATLVLDICFYGNYSMIAVTRFTVFTMGMALGRWNSEGGKISLPLELLSYVLGALSYGLLLIFYASFSSTDMWNKGLYWYPFILIAPAMILLLCRLFSWMERRMPWALRILETVGECSLEIYLIHIVAFDYIHVPLNRIWPLVYVAMVFCGYIYHKALVWILARRPSALRSPDQG